MLKKSQNEELSLREYNLLLFYIARVSGDFNSASKYFDEMKAKNMQFEYSTLYELVMRSALAGETLFMQKCLDEMILNKFELRMGMYKAMITAYLNKKEIDMAFKILDMFFDRIRSTSFAIEIMSMFCDYFNGLNGPNDVSALENLFQRFDAKGKLRFNQKVCASMCVAHAKAGNLDMLEKYIQRLKNSNARRFYSGDVLEACAKPGTKEQFENSQRVYESMCVAHAKAGNLDMMEKYLQYLKIYRARRSGKYVLEAYAKYGTKEDLENSYRRLEQDFGFRDVFYYNKLMAKFK